VSAVPNPAVDVTIAAGRSGRRGPPRRRRWVYRGLAILIAAASVLAAEGLLRLAGYGTSYDLVVAIPEASSPSAHRLNPAIDRVYFGQQDLFGPEPRRFELPKPSGTFRVLVLGASTVIGFPYAPELAFPRQIEALLAAQNPGERIEVLNAGITAINSFEILDLARRAAECQPDLVIIHAGHNEFFGPGGPASTSLPVTAQLVEAAFFARRLRLGQLAMAWMPRGAAAQRNPLEALPRLTEIRLADAEFVQAEANYRRNLNGALDALMAAGIPVLLSTVASNLRDQPPIRSVWPSELPASERAAAEKAVESARQLLHADQPEAALALLDSVSNAAADVADRHYRRGQALDALGRWTEARFAYRAARDHDGCRFRAPSDWGDIVREIAAQRGDDPVTLLDIERLVDDASRRGIPGRELFLEHVHYNLAGHRLLGRRFAECIQTSILKRPWLASRDMGDADLDQRLGLLPEDELVGLSLALETVQTAPLSGALDAARVEDRLLDDIRTVYRSWPASRADLFAELSMHELQQALIPSLTRRRLAEGMAEDALHAARAGVVRRPWDPISWLWLAESHAACGQPAEAESACRRALELEPDWAPAVTLLVALRRTGTLSSDTPAAGPIQTQSE